MYQYNPNWWERRKDWQKVLMIIGGLAIICIAAILKNEYYPEEYHEQPVEKEAVNEQAEKPDMNNFAAGGELTARAAIRSQAKNSNGVEFDNKTYENVDKDNGIYQCKWRISGTNSYGATVTAYGYAQVKYKGSGSLLDVDNWDVLKSYIDE